MSLPTRGPQGISTIDVVNANLFELAEQYLGDATQWTRIADLNTQSGGVPDFVISGPATVMIPAQTTAWPPADITTEQLLFGTFD